MHPPRSFCSKIARAVASVLFENSAGTSGVFDRAINSQEQVFMIYTAIGFDHLSCTTLCALHYYCFTALWCLLPIKPFTRSQETCHSTLVLFTDYTQTDVVEIVRRYNS